MTYYTHDFWLLNRLYQGARFIRKENNTLNPFPGLTFVTICYYEMPDCEIVGVVE